MKSTTQSPQDPVAAAIIAKVQAIAATLHTTDIRARTEIGAEVNRYVEKTGTSEADAVKLFAEETQLHPSTIYDCVKVARAFPLKRIEGITKRRMKSGKTLTFSHFVVLCGLEDEGARNMWVDRCFAAQWSVRDLDGAINESMSARAPEKEPAPASLSAEQAQSVLSTAPLTHRRETTRLTTQLPKIQALSDAVAVLKTVAGELGREVLMMTPSNLEVLDQVLGDAVAGLQEIQARVRSLPTNSAESVPVPAADCHQRTGRVPVPPESPGTRGPPQSPSL